MLIRACDVCETPTGQDAGLYIKLGREMDAAGSMDDVGESLDLCPKHLTEFVSLLLNGTDVAVRKQALTRLRGTKKRL